MISFRDFDDIYEGKSSRMFYVFSPNRAITSILYKCGSDIKCILSIIFNNSSGYPTMTVLGA